MNYWLYVGIDNYIENDIPNLSFATSDAEALFNEISRYNIPSDSHMLTSVTDDQPSRNRILKSLKTLGNKAKDEDNILFYFAGHGFEVDDKSYLMPCDGDLTLPKQTAIEVDAVLEIMKSSRASHKILILDACRNEVDDRALASFDTLKFPDAFVRSLDTRGKLVGWEILFSCGPGQRSVECNDLKAGLWTSSICSAVGTLLDEEKYLTVRDVFERAHGIALDHAKTRGLSINPWYRCDTSKSAILLLPPDISASGKTGKIVLSRSSQLFKDMAAMGVRVLVRDREKKRQIAFRGKETTEEFLNEPHIHLVPFVSQFERLDFSGWKGLKKNNHSFDLRLYLPSIENSAPPYSRLYIFLNGLAESDPATYDGLGYHLANRKGIPSVMIPLPGHFSRHYPAQNHHDPFKAREDERLITQRILQRIHRTPLRILLGLKQIIDDVRHLLKEIRSGDRSYWSQIVEPDCDICLLGYSIGGFAATSLLRLDEKEFKSVFLLESGLFLDRIDAAPMFMRDERVARVLWKHYEKGGDPLDFDEEVVRKFSERESKNEKHFDSILTKVRQNEPYGDEEWWQREPWKILLRSKIESRRIWRDIVRGLYDISRFEKQADRLTSEEMNVFNQIFLGFRRLDYKEALENLKDKILIITGGADDIFPTREILNVGPDTGLTLVQIPDITHWIKHSSRKDWEKWLIMLIDFMEAFNKERR